MIKRVMKTNKRVGVIYLCEPIKKYFTVALFLLSFFVFFIGFQAVKADGIHESAWVKDNAQVLNQTTINQIDHLNKTSLKKIKGHPQLAVITLNGLPNGESSIEDYVHDQMKKLGIGQKGWNNGMLLVIDAKDHVNRLEVGTGLEAALPDGAKSSLVNEKIQQAFQQHDYNLGVSQLTNQVYQYLAVHQSEISQPNNVNDSQSVTPGIEDNSAAAVLQRNKASVAFILFLVICFGLVGFAVAKLVFPKLRNRDQHTLVQQRFAKTGITDNQLLKSLNQFVTDELQQNQSFNIRHLSNPEWWYLLNSLHLKQPISLAQNPKLEMEKGNPLYQQQLISSQTLVSYQTQLQQRKQANLQVVVQAAQQYAVQHHFPGDVNQFVNDTVRQIAQLTWFGLPATTAEFQTSLQNALEISLADATLHYHIDNDASLRAKMKRAGIHNPDQYINDLSDEQKKRFVTNGLVNTALLLGALSLLSHSNSDWHDDNFPPFGGGFGGDSGFDASDFGSGFGGSGDDDGGGFNF